MSKEIVTNGEDFVVEQVDRGFGGARKTVIKVSGLDGSAQLGGLAVDKNGNPILATLALGYASLSGPGTLNATVTLFTSTASGNALALPAGTVNGQIKLVYYSVLANSGTGVISGNIADGTSHTVTLTAVGQFAGFIWNSATGKWNLMMNSGATLA